ncbi:hypothetical protein ACFO4E_11410 [Nocardiopsis mangrovi]|uniref:DUF3817 domain-containing protein n=1 Tax=Nocardiopsis mangrovi TaxID=1179818 RepID=A0ABV9DWH3_9ACTN
MIPVRALRAAAAVEAASLAALLANLLTVHAPAVSSVTGPTHGAAYLAVIATTLAVTAAPRARLYAVVPGIGGLLALSAIRARSRTGPSETGGPRRG